MLINARDALHRCFATCGHCSVLAHPGMYAIVYGTKRLKQFLLSNIPEYVATHYARAIRCRSFTVLEVLLHSASQTAHSHKKQRWSPEFLRVRVDQKHVCGTDYASSAAIKVSAQRTIEEMDRDSLTWTSKPSSPYLRLSVIIRFLGSISTTPTFWICC